MEEIILSKDDYLILKKNKLKLEAHFGVKIKLPEISENTYCSKDVTVASVLGQSKNRSYITKFLEKKRNKIMLARKAKSSSEGNIPVIVLSESDSENAVLAETQNRRKRKRKVSVKKKDNKYCLSLVDSGPTRKENDNDGLVVSNLHKPELKEASLSSAAEHQCITDIPSKSSPEKDDSILVLSEFINPQPIHPLFGKAKDLSKESSSEGRDDTQVADDSIIILSEDIHVPSQACAPSTSYQRKDIQVESMSKNADDGIVVLSKNTPLPAASEFIPLRTSVYAVKPNNKRIRPNSGDTVSCKVPRPVLKERRVLRPIVIDGSNVAREHGKTQNTFSCKGIKICIDFFLKRGHTQVTALLPNFRRYYVHGPFPTVDEYLLDELERSQRIVYTPSRKMQNGRRITCYDDRFIVDLASQTEGVIVSNDNYRDIIGESSQFKKTIEERLLMYCFVGDIIMIPEDPLGRHGPTLDTFLSMKEVTSEKHPNSSQVNNQQFLNQLFRNTNGPTT